MNIPKFYKVIHQNTSANQFLVLNEITNEVCLMKILKVYDVYVFAYLKNINSPHIPRIYEYHEEDGELLVIEEYIKGDTLGDALLSDKLNSEEKLSVLNQLCDGLKMLHKAPKPIVHRDLKPSNIMITGEGIVKLIDYDAAKVYKPGQSQDTVFLGTPEMAAPEQYGFAQSDPRTDIYAMGKLIEKMFPKDVFYKKIVMKATHLDPVDRYQNIDELKNAINRVSGNSLLRKLMVPPGFRHKKFLHAFPATIYYIIVILMSAFISKGVEDISRWSLGRHVFYRIEVLLFLLCPVDIYLHWTGFWDKLPFLRTKDKLKHAVAGTIYFIIVTIIVKLINRYLVDILFPYI